MCSVDQIVTSPLSPRFPRHVIVQDRWAIDDQKVSIMNRHRRKVSPPKSNQTTVAPNHCKTQSVAKVEFDSVVEVRSYNTVHGDNPSTSHGLPLSLGWKYAIKNESMKDNDENQKQPIAYKLDALTRRDRLRLNRVSKQEMDNAVVEMNTIKHSRRSNLIRSTIIPVKRTLPSALGEITKRAGSLTWAVTPQRSRCAAPTRIKTPYPTPRSMTLRSHWESFLWPLPIEIEYSPKLPIIRIKKFSTTSSWTLC